jgi:hypothetical protein
MSTAYVYKRLLFERTVPLSTRPLIADQISAAGSTLFGLFQGVIGLPSNEVIAVATAAADDALLRAQDIPGLLAVDAVSITATVRPRDPAPLQAPGIYAHRWFHIGARHWPRFLELSEAAWPAFERAFASEIVGLWKQDVEPDASLVLLMTRYPDLATWERSRAGAASDAEQHMRQHFRERQGMVTWTSVVATRLFA